MVEALRALGLARSAGPDEVRQTYRSLAKGCAAQRADPSAYKPYKHTISSLTRQYIIRVALATWHSRVAVSIEAVARRYLGAVR